MLFKNEDFKIDMFLLNLSEGVSYNKHHTLMNNMMGTKTMHQKLCDLSLSIFTTLLVELLEKSRQILSAKYYKERSIYLDTSTYTSLIKMNKSRELKANALLIVNRILKAAKQEYTTYKGNDLIENSNIAQYMLAIYLCIFIWPNFESQIVSSNYRNEFFEMIIVTISEVYLRHPKSQLGLITVTLLQKITTCKNLSLAFNNKMKSSINLKMTPLVVGNYCDLTLSLLLRIVEDCIINSSSFYLKNILAIINNLAIFPRVLNGVIGNYFLSIIN